jgi:hypothetical protein
LLSPLDLNSERAARPFRAKSSLYLDDEQHTPKSTGFALFSQIFPDSAKAIYSLHLAASDGAYDEEWFLSCRHFYRQRGVRRVVRQVLLAGKETEEGPANLRNVITDGPPQHRIASLKSVQDRPLSDLPFDLEAHLAVDASQCPQMCRKLNPDHRNV